MLIINRHCVELVSETSLKSVFFYLMECGALSCYFLLGRNHSALLTIVKL